MQRVVSDTGRVFAPFVALPLMFGWVSLNFGGFSLLAWGGADTEKEISSWRRLIQGTGPEVFLPAGFGG